MMHGGCRCASRPHQHPDIQNVKRKIQQVISRAINIAQSATWLIRAEKYYVPLVRTIDTRAVAEIVDRFAGDEGFADGRKYLRLGWYLRDNLARAVMLGLHDGAKLRVLDLGSGAGYFLLASRHFGHRVMGFDLPGNRFYEEMLRQFELPRVEAAIKPFEPMPDLDGKFDLITAFAVTFASGKRFPEATEWGRDEWHYFINDLRRFLNPGGRVFLRLNIGRIAGLYDARRYAYLRNVPKGFRVRIINRRELDIHME